MTVKRLDFTGITPSSGGGLTLIPPGPYRLRVTAVDADTKSAAGNEMVTISFVVDDGPEIGTAFKDYFSPVPAPDKEHITGMRKFSQCLHSLGMKPSGAGNMDFQKLVNRTCTANIATEPMQPTAQYPNPRDVSKIRSYEMPTPVTSPNGATATKAAAPAQAPAAAASTGAATAVAEAPAAAPAQAEAASDGLSVDESSEDIFE